MFRYDFQGKPQGVHAGVAGRVGAAAIALACVALLVTAAWLRPDERGHGTHTQLGLPPCGFENATGLPCLTCGMTTAFSLAADGRLVSALRVQPMGALLAVSVAVLLLLCGYAAASGLNLRPLASALTQAPVLITLAGVLIAAWAYKMMLAMAG